jgi:hypothetical protein
MRKEFNDTGLCVVNKHFMVDTTNKIEQIFTRLIERGKYFTINRSRQFGKTTTISLISDLLKTKDEYFVIETSFEGIGDDIFQDQKSFSYGFLKHLYSRTKFFNPDLANIFLEESKQVSNLSDLSEFITDFTFKKQKKVVLIIDEVDKSSNNQLFLSFIGMLRDKYLKRDRGEDYTFHSVILAGVHDVKTIKLKIRPDSEEKLNSPWNIAVDFNIDLSFKAWEIVSMLDSYTNETGIEMDKKAISEKLYYYTSGYPYLVSKMCKFIDEDIIVNRENKNWTIDDVDQAFHKIVYSGYTTTLFDSMSKNLENNKELYDFIFDIVVQNAKKSFSINNPIVNLAHVYGIIKDAGKCAIHNRIFAQRIYDYMLSKLETSNYFESVPFHDKYFIGSDIDMPYIMRRYQQFMKEQYSHKDKKFIEREGRLLFLSYLKPIINGNGYDFKEPVVGEDRRMDIVVTFGKKRYVIELKIWYGEEYHQSGLQQLSDYLDIYSLKKGWLLIYDFRKSKKYTEEIINFKDKEIFTVWV